MRILHIAPTISTDVEPGYKSFKSGLGYMVFDIAHSLELSGCDVTLFTPNVFYSGGAIQGVKIQSWTRAKFISQFRIRNLLRGMRFLGKPERNIREYFRALYFFSCREFLSRIVMDYDIVHLHGLGALTIAAMDVLDNIGRRYVVTLHGLLSFRDVVRAPSWLKKYERFFLRNSYETGRVVSFVSSGDRLEVCSYLNADPPSFIAIPNGCDVRKKEKTCDIRNALGISEDTFLFVFAGNISPWKNQMALLEAFKVLTEAERRGIKVLFCGFELDGGSFRDAIHNNGMDNCLLLAGAIPRSQIHNYYIAADATVLTSVSEGFGLSIIEGMVYGKPCLVYRDLPAIIDIGSDCAMEYPADRSPKSLAFSLLAMKNRKWDSKLIESYSKCFSFDNMARKYIILYNGLLNKAV